MKSVMCAKLYIRIPIVFILMDYHLCIEYVFYEVDPTPCDSMNLFLSAFVINCNRRSVTTSVDIPCMSQELIFHTYRFKRQISLQVMTFLNFLFESIFIYPLTVKFEPKLLLYYLLTLFW